MGLQNYFNLLLRYMQIIGESSHAEEVERPTFWNTLSLEELTELQGVGPVADLDSLGSLWPADDDPDRLLTFLKEERSARRRITRGDAG
jgi:hypothetical protein